MKRGDLVTVALPGDFGKPCPALVIQSDHFNDSHPTALLCLVTSDLRDAPIFRLTITPAPENGLQQPAQIQVDKIMAVLRNRVGPAFGTLDDATMLRVNRALAVMTGIA